MGTGCLRVHVRGDRRHADPSVLVRDGGQLCAGPTSEGGRIVGQRLHPAARLDHVRGLPHTSREPLCGSGVGGAQEASGELELVHGQRRRHVDDPLTEIEQQRERGTDVAGRGEGPRTVDVPVTRDHHTVRIGRDLRDAVGIEVDVDRRACRGRHARDPTHQLCRSIGQPGARQKGRTVAEFESRLVEATGAHMRERAHEVGRRTHLIAPPGAAPPRLLGDVACRVGPGHGRRQLLVDGRQMENQETVVVGRRTDDVEDDPGLVESADQHQGLG